MNNELEEKLKKAVAYYWQTRSTQRSRQEVTGNSKNVMIYFVGN
jgi:hypothetical protein